MSESDSGIKSIGVLSRERLSPQERGSKNVADFKDISRRCIYCAEEGCLYYVPFFVQQCEAERCPRAEAAA